MTKFLRRTWSRYSKLGRRRKKKQFWRRPTGRHNKMREKRKGYPSSVSIGYRKERKLRGIIKACAPVIIRNIIDLEKIRDGKIGVLAGIGKRKKIEIIKKAKEMKVRIANINLEKFIKDNEKAKKTEKKKAEVKNESKKEKGTSIKNS